MKYMTLDISIYATTYSCRGITYQANPHVQKLVPISIIIISSISNLSKELMCKAIPENSSHFHIQDSQVLLQQGPL